jgi:D-3-phosphoglycerate dehydrogenase
MCEVLSEAHACIIGADPVTEAVLDSAPHLRLVAMHGVGVDHIDVEACTRRGVMVTSAAGSNTRAVAELTLGLMFCLARGLVGHHQATSSGRWERSIGFELRGKVVGLVGLGRIGREVAGLARAVGMRALAHDPWGDPEQARRLGVRLTTLDEVLSGSDFVSLHIPLTPATRDLIDSRALARMKKGSYLINTARGGLVDEAALAAALRSGHLAAAAVDTFTAEPPVDSPLLDLPNVVLTPHIGAYTTEAVASMSLMTARSVVAWLDSKTPPGLVNPEVMTGGLKEDGADGD